MADILINPYVIIFIVVAFVVGNIMALKYTAHMKFGEKKDTHETPKTTDTTKKDNASPPTEKSQK